MGAAAMRLRIERALHAIWYGPQRPPWVMRALSRGYERVINTPRPAQRPEVPVIIVGALVAGGGGKTPTVVAIAKALQAQGWRVAVISRGYGRRGRGLHAVEPGDDPFWVGDEPAMIAQLTGVQVWVCADRFRALKAAVTAGAEVVIADDGLQHQALPRSFECCVIDGQRGIGNAQLLPAGPLRQPLARLRMVDQVLVRGGDAEAMAQRLGIGRAHCHGLRRQSLGLRQLNSDRCEAVDFFAGKSVTLMTGIADPEAFADTLRSMGMNLIEQRRFADHHRYRAEDAQGLLGPVVVTEKDAVKLKQIGVQADLWILMSEMVLPDAMIEQVLAHVHAFRGEAADCD